MLNKYFFLEINQFLVKDFIHVNIQRINFKQITPLSMFYVYNGFPLSVGRITHTSFTKPNPTS